MIEILLVMLGTFLVVFSAWYWAFGKLLNGIGREGEKKDGQDKDPS